ncbi:amino acid aminotransferase [Mycolicibacterium goodii]|uniref:amino acid aminotransferase n=1 Tax=Mycolicibacterium goodii TaxID=134601 RepID=UPI001BDD2D66|nr:amino acid aminotransferase [Mycolicibacterium goodii]MBU8831154.1 amino acid aminotransferase [Mycolicibacterium goodii]
MKNNYCPAITNPGPSRIAADRLATAARPGTVRDILTTYAGQLTAAGAFADVTADDARTVAAFIAWDVCHGDESTALRQRAAAVTEGSWGGWDHPHGVARAFTIAATVLDAL